jgi:hypothetical protein
VALDAKDLPLPARVSQLKFSVTDVGCLVAVPVLCAATRLVEPPFDEILGFFEVDPACTVARVALRAVAELGPAFDIFRVEWKLGAHARNHLASLVLVEFGPNNSPEH